MRPTQNSHGSSINLPCVVRVEGGNSEPVIKTTQRARVGVFRSCLHWKTEPRPRFLARNQWGNGDFTVTAKAGQSFRKRSSRNRDWSVFVFLETITRGVRRAWSGGNVGEVCNLAWREGRRRRDGGYGRLVAASRERTAPPRFARPCEVANLAYFAAGPRRSRGGIVAPVGRQRVCFNRLWRNIPDGRATSTRAGRGHRAARRRESSARRA